MDLLERFKQYIQTGQLFQHTDRLLLAVSGGLDSVVLCALCKEVGYDFNIAHCNFKLRREESDRDESFVREIASAYQVPFYSTIFDTTAYASEKKQSIEEAARTLRYEWFYELLNSDPAGAGSYVLTAHHADDNIETVVMNFFRGTGISGLRGMLPKQGKVIRPLLFATRAELESFQQQQGLAFVTDHTNLETTYTRNHFRHSILPLVAEKYPGAAGNVLKNIKRFADAETLYLQAVQLNKKKLVEIRDNEVHIPVLKLQNSNAPSTLMYEILKDYAFSAHQADEAMALLTSGSGKFLQSLTHRLLRNRKWLIITPLATTEAATILIEEGVEHINFPGGELTVKRARNGVKSHHFGDMVAHVDADEVKFPLLLRKWKQGDYFYPLGMQKKKKLSRFFIDKKLSLSQKENTWIVEMDKKIIWIVGHRIDDRFKLVDSTAQVLTLSVK
ncbi:MAG: tRNA lysidine(34) synthetase TilS [Ferruginibacter sp.]|nr:tRNA lysidine(34) synthetase TilS [Ferruginibacter sp.]